jgi:hypothetical protein
MTDNGEKPRRKTRRKRRRKDTDQASKIADFTSKNDQPSFGIGTLDDYFSSGHMKGFAGKSVVNALMRKKKVVKDIVQTLMTDTKVVDKNQRPSQDLDMPLKSPL